MTIKRYSELIKFKSFQERLDYLRLPGVIGYETFGGLRYLNQRLYKSYEWIKLRREIILRDNGCDLAHPDHPISGKVVIHHINPITKEDLKHMRGIIFDPENLITVSYNTHQSIHYSKEDTEPLIVLERRANDTCPWKE